MNAMKTRMQHSLRNLKVLQDCMESNEVYPLLSEEYKDLLTLFSANYEQDLKEKLDLIYEQYFGEEKAEPVLNYLSNEGVPAHCPDFPGTKGTVHLSIDPVQFEFRSEDCYYKYCLWKEAP